MDNQDADVQAQRRKSLDSHSSSNFTSAELKNSTIEDNGNPNFETSQGKHKGTPFGSFMASMFAKSSDQTTSNTSFAWLSMRSEKQKSENLNLENLYKITSPSEAVAALKNSLDVKTDDYYHASLDLVTHLCELDTSKQVAGELGKLGACALIDQILGLRIVSSQSCECCLRAMCSLITHPVAQEGPITQSSASIGISNNVKKLSSSGTIYRIIKAGHTHLADVIVLEWCLRVVNYVCSEEGMLSKLLACGGCDLLTRALSTHTQCDEILTWTCRNIYDFISNDGNASSNTQAKFGDGGVCDCIVATVLSQYWEKMTEQTAMWILKAIGSLARYHAANKRQMGEAGVCLLIQRLYLRFGLQHNSFCEGICWAIGNLSYPDETNQTLLGSCSLDANGGNACDIVIRSLHLHLHSPLVVQESLRAVRNLSHQHDDNLNSLFSLNVVDTVVTVLRQYREVNSDVMQWVWYATATLAEHEGCLSEFGKQGVCSAVVASITRFSDQEDLVQWAALAIAKIAVNPELSNQLGDSMCCEALVNALQLHTANADVAEELLNAIGALCKNSNNIREIFGRKLNICEVVVKALVKHEKVDTVVESGLYAVLYLIRHDVGDVTHNSRSTTATDGEDSAPLLATTTTTMHSSSNVTETLSSALDKLATMLITARVHKVIARVLTKYGAENDIIAEHGCRILFELTADVSTSDVAGMAQLLLPSTAILQRGHRETCFVKLDTLLKMGQSGVANALCTVLQSHMMNVSVTQCALLALDRMCIHEKNTPLLRNAGVNGLIVKALYTHFLYTESIVTTCYSLITRLCYDEQCRERLGVEGCCEVVLQSLAHHLTSANAVHLGCEVLSALCLCPAHDAIASIINKENLNNSAQTKTAAGAAVDWISFDVNNMDHLNILTHNASTAGSDAATDSKGKSVGSVPSVASKTTDTFFLGYNTLRGTRDTLSTVSSGFESLTDAASNLLTSAGMSDIESAQIAARQQSMYARREGNNERLMRNGINAMIFALIHKHSDSPDVLISICNVVNSLSMYPANRLAMSRDGLLELLISVFQRCIGFNDAKDVSKDEAHSFADAASRRVLSTVLCVALGSLCLPENADKPSHRANLNSEKQLPRINQDHLGNLEVCQCLALCLLQSESDPLLLEVTMRAIYYLILGHEVNQSRLGTIESNQLMVRILREQGDKPKIVYYSCLCISALAQNNRDNSLILGQERVCEAVVAALSRYVNNEDVAEACCHAIFGLKALNQMLGKAGACEYVLQTLTLHPANATVAQWVCRAIGTLAECEENKIELDKHNVCKIVTQALQKHVSSDSILSAALFLKDTSSAGVAQWGCTAIYYIAKGYNSEEYQAKLVAAGACEAVARALVKYSEVETVSYCCCRTLVVLLMNNEIYKSKLGALGVCACIVESMHLYPSSVQVAKWGCRAVAVLAESNEANVARLGMAGGCETIPVIIQAHQNSEHVAGAGCDVIAFMVENSGTGGGGGNGFAARLGHAGGCEAVISVLRKHYANPSVVSRAAIALASLARDKGNSSWLGPAGASDALYTVLQIHQHDASVCKFVLSAMGNLCVIENNKERLGAVGSCDLVVRVFNTHILDRDTVKAAGLAVGKLCELITRGEGSERDAVNMNQNVSSPQTTNNIATNEMSTPQRMRRESLALTSAAASAHVSLDAMGSAKSVLDNSDRNSPNLVISPGTTNTYHRNRPNRSALYEANACEALVVALNHHLTNPDVATILCRTISIVAYDHSCVNERISLGELGACKAVTNALQFHEGVEDVAKCGCLAVKALAYHNKFNQVALHGCGVNSIVIQILRGYRYATSGPSIVEAAAWAVSSLAMDCPLNKVSLGAAGACEGLLEVAELHSRDVETTYFTLKALFHVCDGNSPNRLKISFSGAADILMSVLNRYPDDERVVEFVLSTMIGMCLNKVGQSRLGTVGMHKAVVTTLYRYEKSSEYIVLLCCALVTTLSANNKDNQSKLGNAGACKAIVAVMTKFMHSTSSSYSNNSNNSNSQHLATTSGTSSKKLSLSASASLSKNDSVNSLDDGTATSSSEDGLISTGVSPSTSTNAVKAQSSNTDMDIDFARTSLSALIDEFSVLKEGCKAVVQLSSNNEQNRQKFLVTGVLDILTTILSSSFAVGSGNSSGVGSSNNNSGSVSVSDDTKQWAKQAMDALIGETYA